jgi:hypothetical protein
MELSRYAVIDAYILEELRHEYQTLTAKGRIRLLRKLSREGTLPPYQSPPYEIALLAVEDPNVEVRQWIARHSEDLDYREYRHTDKQFRFPDRNLGDRLSNDPDPFVRACLRENPHNQFVKGAAAGVDTIAYFRASTRLERSALVRNSQVADELIVKLFDSKDTNLGIELEERKELVLAFLTNQEFLADKETKAGLSSQRVPPDGLAWSSANKFLRTLWELTLTWSGEPQIQQAVYRYVPVDNAIKVQMRRT